MFLKIVSELDLSQILGSASKFKITAVFNHTLITNFSGFRKLLTKR